MKPKVEIKDITEAPNLETVKKLFNVDENYVIISYGNKIYAPNKTLSTDLMVHELVHCERQGFNEVQAERWWKKYIDDKDFRLKEEVVAYRQQYKFACNIFKDRNKRYKILFMLASHLSSPTYGSLTTQKEAEQLISG